ncbi:MAG: LemA family protein [Candidatus Cloacimonadales bacterium]|jgi:LemA protein|nr:LemA family protein [Candidatus Cloacimonadota bacterium]MDD2649626.1 LemA family protein [Candidatus Cloacimonadota bacterium]MDD3501109.1 LemA family protein [Candidatus Cloacimonadota bacterium]MDX9976596.1 LemA family protein [Candidatus Cloacimonadales bacterium]
MKKSLIVIIVIVLILLICGSFIISRYNNMRTMRVDVDNGWAEVDNQLTRRYDLIPNFVETVKGYAKHEREVLTEVTEMRSRVGSAQNVQDKMDSNNELTSALGRLMVVVERYPELKANQNFMALQDELAGTENRLSVARKRYNDAVTALNRYLVVFPNNILAGMFNIQQAEFFQAPEAAATAPKIEF